MKKPEEYVDYFQGTYMSSCGITEEARRDLETVFKQAQKDTIEYALNEAAENAEIGYDWETKEAPNCMECGNTGVNKNSILSLKDKLFKEVDDESY